MTNFQPAPAPAPVVEAKPRKAKRWPWIVAIVAALFLGMIMGGSSDSGKTATADTKAAPSTVVSTVAAPASTVTQTVTVTPAAPPAPTGFGPGTHLTTKMKPGTYSTEGPSPSPIPNCYWARLSNTSGELSGIIASGLPQGPATVTIAAGDAAFQTSGCKPWVLQG